MSKKVKIKSTLTHRANQSINLPEGLGEITFNESCIAEVSPEIAERLSSMQLAGIEIVKEETPGAGDPVEFTEESLSKLKMKDLQDLAKESELPEEEWKGFTKKADIVTYILGKVNGDPAKDETPGSNDDPKDLTQGNKEDAKD